MEETSASMQPKGDEFGLGKLTTYKKFANRVKKARLEFMLNPLLQVLFRDKGFETDFFSPCVIYIGRKIK